MDFTLSSYRVFDHRAKSVRARSAMSCARMVTCLNSFGQMANRLLRILTFVRRVQAGYHGLEELPVHEIILLKIKTFNNEISLLFQ